MNSINIKELKLLNWNANGIKSKKSTLLEFLSQHQIDIVCITETHLKATEKFKLNGYLIYRTDRNSTHSSGGVAIIIKKSIKHYQSDSPTLTHLEATSVVISTDKYNLKILAAYNPPKKTVQRKDFIALFNDIPTILLGDLNSEHQNWGCLKTNQNGNKLLNISTDIRILISAPSSNLSSPWKNS